MSLIDELYQDLNFYYNMNYRKMGSPNYMRHNNILSWNRYIPWESFMNNYDHYEWVAQNIQYSFHLEDDSFVQIYYKINMEFDIIQEACLAFIPSPKAINERKMTYMRFDCGSHTDYLHTIYHMHIGYPKSKFRISLYKYPLPSTFLDFIFLTVYNQINTKPCEISTHINDLETLTYKYSHYLTFL